MPQASKPLDERRTLWATSLQNQLASTHRRSRPRPLVPCKRSRRPSPQNKWPANRNRARRGHFSRPAFNWRTRPETRLTRALGLRTIASAFLTRSAFLVTCRLLEATASPGQIALSFWRHFALVASPGRSQVRLDSSSAGVEAVRSHRIGSIWRASRYSRLGSARWDNWPWPAAPHPQRRTAPPWARRQSHPDRSASSSIRRRCLPS
jgi:hypothetical protein